MSPSTKILFLDQHVLWHTGTNGTWQKIRLLSSPSREPARSSILDLVHSQRFDLILVNTAKMGSDSFSLIHTLVQSDHTVCLREMSEELQARMVQLLQEYRIQEAMEESDINLPARKFYRLEPAPEEITRRERDVLKLLVDEYTTTEIAELLHLSNRTVGTHRQNLLSKIGARNTVGLVKYALRHGIVN